ncbi:DUF4199 domain-containing protein [Roseivirga sp. BDSF3-8]|uniref:DUF4199 domain-containing protein n=1 Tax=Roseivirga sp. BDSF3-8 TaxID=3241598 RepID=UPI0035327D86
MSKNQNSLLTEAVKYGAIFAIVSFVIQLVLWAVDYTYLVSGAYNVLLILCAIGAFIWAGLHYRKSIGGYLSYGNAYKFLIVSTVAFFIIGILLSWIMYNVVDPELPAMLQEVQIEQTIDFLESMNADDAIIDQSISDMEKQDLSDILLLLQSAAIMIVVFAVLHLLFALIVKKSRPEFE